jgi:predicted ATPase
VTDRPHSLSSQAPEVLTVLAGRPREVVGKSELVARVWPNIATDENTFRMHVAGLRKALGDGQLGHRYADRPEQKSPLVGAKQTLPKRSLSVMGVRVVGRARAIRALRTQVLGHELVTIVGTAGIGKTTIAQAVAEALLPDFPDGAYFVDLAPVEDPQFVVGSLGSALGILLPADDAVRHLVEYLKDRRMLIVLDSCEHVIEAAASLVEQILAGASGVHILATSRERLRADGERISRLPPLDVPADRATLTAAEALEYSSVRLFVERAAANLEGFELTDTDASAVSNICRKLGGIALAIELAAARVDSFGVQQLAVLLVDRLSILKDGRRAALPRHRSLIAALDWSYEFLPENERQTLRRISIFVGGFTLASAVGVAGDDNVDVVETLPELVAKSLVSADVAGEIVRYRLLDTTRAYGRQKLTETGEFETYARRHAQHHLEWFKRAETEWLSRTSSSSWLEDHGGGLDDVRSALSWSFSPTGDASIGAALTVASLPLWLELSLLSEGQKYVKRAIASLVEQPAHSEHDALKLHMSLARTQEYGRQPEKEEEWTEVLRLAEKLGDIWRQGWALCGLSGHRCHLGDLRGALAFAERASAVAAKAEYGDVRAMSTGMIGTVLFRSGDYSNALRHIEAVVRWPARDSEWPVYANQLILRPVLSVVLWITGFPDQAEANAKTSGDEARATGNAFLLANVLGRASCPISLFTGDLSEAAQCAEMLLDCSLKHALRTWHAVGLCFKGMLLLERGDRTGLAVLQAALRWLREARFTDNSLDGLCVLAQGLGRAGQIAEARQVIDEALDLSDRNQERWYLPELLRVKGELIRLDPHASPPETAEGCFLQSLAEARRQGALSWELRAATSTARLWRDEDRCAAAHELLSGVYHRFTEGFDTRDLRTARTLIDELEAP